MDLTEFNASMIYFHMCFTKCQNISSLNVVMINLYLYLSTQNRGHFVKNREIDCKS